MDPTARNPFDGPKGRVGLIVPSSNRCTEAQMARFSPEGMTYHVARCRMTGKNHVEPDRLMEVVREPALTLADASVDLIVFHCTGSSMEGGPGFDREIARGITEITGIRATTTATAVVEALRHLGVRKLVLASPYVQATNDSEVRFLHGEGFEVLADRALGLGNSDAYIGVTPDEWVETLRAMKRPDADAYFVSCTNTRSIECVEEMERAGCRPAITSNQATIWHCMRLLGIEAEVKGLGQLLRRPAATPARA